MHHVVKALAILVVGVYVLVPPPPAYGEVDEGTVFQIFKTLITPSQNRTLFKPVQRSSAQLHIEMGDSGEKDHSEHGGIQWEFWPNRGSWEKHDEPSSILDDGRASCGRREGVADALGTLKPLIGVYLLGERTNARD